ncbi:phosphatase 2C-like domain-containing protein [Aspergillus minisclerotigenes]|uniref:Phosphatase 2C-like domain-containing protein n=1 Tax=Aspergillus minisclerotigenes TaxID=656917 RepID=A0A5N6IT92_9EURO|nr:phosphatase 2C-like domain-containing protein [Aspergillus minisclerotigenes]
MLSLRVRGTRLASRVTRTSLSQTQVRNFHSRKDTAPAINKTWRSFAIAGAVSAPGFWLLTSTRDDDVPRLEAPPTGHLVAEPGPSKEEVTRIISQDAYSFPVRSVTGVNRYDGTQLASNSLCEDRFTHGIFPSPLNDGTQWMAWAVFDGHAGWQTAELLKDQLLLFVRHSLSKVKSASTGEKSIPDEVLQHAIVKAFLDLDDSIVKTALQTARSSEPLQDKLKKLAPAYAGSCALLSMYDSVTGSLHVACTGDSRAVLGQQKPDGTWEAIPLSVDQTGSNEDEVARINQEHPGEENIAKDGRILGMMVSRAFGDSRWKWSLDLQQDLKQRFGGPSPLTPKYDVRTPPYLTAEPVVTTTKIDPGKPSFVILATDGMWDTLSNQQAVDLVGKWLDAQIHGHPISQPKTEYKRVDFGDLGNGVDWEFEEGRTTIQDDNAAVHLVRNSLGGNHHELIAGRLALGSPFSRHIRDDVTVQVAFFNCPHLLPK